MATLNEIAYNIRNLYRKGRGSNNDILSLDQIKFLIKNYRALYLRREYNKNEAILDTFEQKVCVELEKVDASLCPDNLIGYEVLRSKQKLPDFIRGTTSLLISYIGSVNGTTRWQYVPAFAMEWNKYNKISGNRIKAYILDGYLYVFPDCRVKYAMVRGILENPQEGGNYSNEDGSACYNDDQEYPIPEDMIVGLTQDILKNEFNMMEKLGTNDESNDTIQN
jgi:hypothetical protein